MELEEENPFIRFYAQLSHQGNMLGDYVRTGTYQQAIFRNPSDFKGKVVLDVGTGTGILSFFAAQAGAKRVYAVDHSDSCEIAKKLSEANGFSNVITVLKGKIEEIILPEKVDVIVSEPIGFLLVHERMLESYVLARERFLLPGGKMFPSAGSIIIGPISDDSLYQEQMNKATFWDNEDFFGIDLTPAIEQSYLEAMSQPIVGYFDSKKLISSHRVVHSIDFTTVTCEELKDFTIQYSMRCDKIAIMHGFGCWFDIEFQGTDELVTLSTSPDSPGTHWYQCQILLQEPLAVNKGQIVEGSLDFKSNNKFSYDIYITSNIKGTEIQSTNLIHLHDQAYQYLYSPQAAIDSFGNSHGS